MSTDSEATRPLSTSINCLARELLVEIFLWYLQAAYESRTGDSHFRTTLRRVCRTWQDIVQSEPSLSTYICLTNGRHVRDLLIRSGPVLSLHVYERTEHGPDFESLKLVMDHFERVEQAKLTLAEPTIESLVSSARSVLPGSRVSRLRSVELCAPGRMAWAAVLQLFQMFTFPRLSAISCTYCRVQNLTPLFVPTLRCLHIIQPTPMQPRDLVELLAPLHLLEELVLVQAFIEFEGPDCSRMLAPRQAVSFPHLQHLSIKGSYHMLGIDFIRDILYPSTAHLSLYHCYGTFPTLGRHPFILSTIASKLHNVSPKSLLIHTDVIHKPDQYGMLLRTETVTKIILWPARVPLDELRKKGSDNCNDADALFQLSMPMDVDFLLRLLKSTSASLSSVQSAVFVDTTARMNERYLTVASECLAGLEELGLERYEHCSHHAHPGWPFQDTQAFALWPRLNTFRRYPEAATCRDGRT